MKKLFLLLLSAAIQLSAQTNISVNNIKATGNVTANGTVTGSNIPASIPGAGTCVNQFVRVLNTGLPPTCATVGSSDLAASLALVTPSIDAASGISLNLSGSAIIGTTLGVSGTSSLAAVSVTQVTNTGNEFLSTGKVVSWNVDTGISRDAAGTIDVGNGTQGDKSGSMNLANIAATGTINKVTVTQPATSATLTIANGKTLTANSSTTIAGVDGKSLTVNNSLTLAGTDGTTQTFPSTSATIARTDAGQTFIGVQVLPSPTINGTPTGTGIPTLTAKKGSGSGTNYNSASTTYAVVDSTNLCLTVTIPTGWKLDVMATAEMESLTAAVNIFLALSDNAACGTANAGIIYEQLVAPTSTSTSTSAVVGAVINGDGAVHNVALQFKTTNGADSVVAVNSTSTRTPLMRFNLSPSN